MAISSSTDNGGAPRDEENRLALLDELRQAERRAVSSRVASVIAHLIGTPLHVIAGRASLIRGAPADGTVSENARRIEEQVERLAARIRALIDYLTLPEPPPKREAVAAVATSALELYAAIGKERHVGFELVGEYPTDAGVDGTAALVVLTSLLSLATRVAPRGAVCRLAVSVEDGRVVFSLIVPGLEPPSGRIDSLEPPERPERAPSEVLQVLSVSSAIARRSGGRLEVASDAPEEATIRYLAPRLD
jgi:signal transduction histidine kinase